MIPTGLIHDDHAVSPIVGSVLILALTTAAISAVLFWGLPTLQQAQARGALDAAVDQLDLADTLIEDLAEQGAETTASVRLTTGQGGLRLDPEGERWVMIYQMNRTNPANLSLSGLDDEDHRYRLHNRNSLETPTLHINHSLLTASGYRDLDPANPKTIAGNDDKQILVKDDGVFHDIEDDVLRIRIYDTAPEADNLLAVAWIVDVGALRYELSSTAGFHAAHLVNGAIRVETPRDDWIVGLDAIRVLEPPRVEEPLLYVTFQRIRPDATANVTAGSGSWSLDLVSSQNRVLSPSTPEVLDVRIRVVGDHGPTWKRWITKENDELVAEGTDAYLAGPIDLSVFYHETTSRTGFQAK